MGILIVGIDLAKNLFARVDMRSKMHHTGQTGSRPARLTGCRANRGGDEERMEPC